MSGFGWAVWDGYAQGDRNMNMENGRAPPCQAGREGTMRTENMYFHTPKSRSFRLDNFVHCFFYI